MARGARTTEAQLIGLQCFCVLLIVAALALGGWLAWFYLDSSVGGRDLLGEARAQISSASRRMTPATTGQAAAGCEEERDAVGELVIPRISLVAPVVQGDGDAQLADAVGHVVTSVWPGGTGTTVLVAHDVTWFHDLDELHEGTQIEYVSDCVALSYRVTGSQVVMQGTQVANAPGHLDLVTCWPLDALWFTSKRYLVQAEQVGGTTTVAPITVASMPAAPRLAVPPSLRTVDTLANNPTPLGPLSVTGAPTRAFDESPGALGDAAAAQDVFYAAQRAAEAGDASAWAVIAPGVPQSTASPLAASSVDGFGDSLSTTLIVSGDRLVGASLRVQEVLASGEEWTISSVEGLVGGKLAVIGWSMSPA